MIQANLHPYSAINQNLGLATAMNNKVLYGELLCRFAQNQASFYQQFNALGQQKQKRIHCVHSLKGLAGNIGAKSLEQSASKLEYALLHNSEEKAIGILLSETNDALLLVLSEIDRIQIDFPKDQHFDNTMDEISVNRLWKQLEEELTSYDANATETMKRILKHSIDCIKREELNLLSHAIMNYQFEEALEHFRYLDALNIQNGKGT